ncbi:alpha/beta hydrolase [Pseudoalteromonas sp. T1lg65]|uniref:alpha/beta hydrolase n=1 Tax=Pseudoalteromonas sp. T1lg65 TaxID=2077101 RepID=UPI003F794119
MAATSLQIENLEKLLTQISTLQMKTLSTGAVFYANVQNGEILLSTNSGWYQFDVDELFRLLFDVVFRESIQVKAYRGEHKIVHYKLPLVLYLLRLCDYQLPNIESAVASIQVAEISDDEGELLHEKYDTYLQEKRMRRLYSRTREMEAPQEIVINKRAWDDSGSSSDSIDFLAPDKIAEANEYFNVDLLYATSRARNSSIGLFGSEKVKQLNYGVAHVSLPTIHEKGVVERPPFYERALRLFNIERADPAKHIVLKGDNALSERDFFNSVDTKSDCVVFIHGFNVTFEEAVCQAAQLKVDLAFDGHFSLFSWPSIGDLRGYVADKDRAVGAGHLLATFIEKMLQANTGNLYIVAHSMGGYCLSQAMKSLNADINTGRIKIALAAPDIDQEDFKNIYADSYTRHADKITIYACDRDRALFVSRLLHQGRRVGDAKPITIFSGMETVDASEVTKFLSLNHSYVFQDRRVLLDLDLCLFQGLSPRARHLRPLPSLLEQTHWGFDPV